MTDLKVNVSRTINAPIEKVFDAWLNAETLSQFMTPMLGMPNPKTENDPREGGSFVIKMRVGEDEIPHTGEYLEINRPSKLVFTWISPFSTVGSTVTINFKSIDDSTTDVELIHVKFADEESRSNHEGGWGSILDKLNETLC
ncbi:MAG: SRPBCC domain-containing protein [Gammaproteobacteria bacterium]|nr:SRPBCC domain-containing protein [Gammaproteobacteria bacterium]